MKDTDYDRITQYLWKNPHIDYTVTQDVNGTVVEICPIPKYPCVVVSFDNNGTIVNILAVE